jgi:predicted transcriptional regulator
MNKVFRIFGLSSEASLGPLERQLLELLWLQGSATVRELVDQGTIQLAYTTIMTTLDRLYKKGFLSRVPEGRAFRYQPAQSREELQRAAALEGIRQLLGSRESSVLPLSYLVEAISDHDAELLDQLHKLVEERRSKLRSQEID